MIRVRVRVRVRVKAGARARVRNEILDFPVSYLVFNARLLGA